MTGQPNDELSRFIWQTRYRDTEPPEESVEDTRNRA
jgi:hypothetical protein